MISHCYRTRQTCAGNSSLLWQVWIETAEQSSYKTAWTKSSNLFDVRISFIISKSGLMPDFRPSMTPAKTQLLFKLLVCQIEIDFQYNYRCILVVHLQQGYWRKSYSSTAASAKMLAKYFIELNNMPAPAWPWHKPNTRYLDAPRAKSSTIAKLIGSCIRMG